MPPRRASSRIDGDPERSRRRRRHHHRHLRPSVVDSITGVIPFLCPPPPTPSIHRNTIRRYRRHCTSASFISLSLFEVFDSLLPPPLRPMQSPQSLHLLCLSAFSLHCLLRSLLLSFFFSFFLENLFSSLFFLSIFILCFFYIFCYSQLVPLLRWD